MELREYYYSKPAGIALFIGYIFMTAGFTYAATIPDQSRLYYCFMVLVAAACAAVLYFVLKKWLLPAYRNEPALVLDDKVLNLKNSYPPIPWTKIEFLKYTHGRYGNVIGVKLKDLDAFLRNQSSPKKGWGLKFNKLLYGYHFALSTTLLKGNNHAIFDTMNDFLNRFR